MLPSVHADTQQHGKENFQSPESAESDSTLDQLWNMFCETHFLETVTGDNYFLRVMAPPPPPPGHKHGIYIYNIRNIYIFILTAFYLTFFLAYTLAFYLTFVLAFYLAFCLAYILKLYPASILTLTFYLASILEF